MIAADTSTWVAFLEGGGDSVEADQHSVLIAITIPGSI
jgi:hypothetical protein